MDEPHRAISYLDRTAAQSSPAFPQLTEAVEAVCSTIGSPKSVAYLLNRELSRALQSSELFEPRWMGSEVIVHAGEAITVAISHLDTQARLPFILTSDMAIMSAHAACDVIIECFELPPQIDLSVFEPDARPRIVWKERVLPGRMLLLRAGQGIRFTVGRSSALLTITTRASIEYGWYFEPKTLAPLSIHSSSASSAMAQTLSDFLGTYGDDDAAIASIESLLEHPAHFVRYAAARDLLRASFEDGVCALEKLSSDVHPHVRNAAKVALEGLSSV